jgi:Short C-terminal domain
MNLFRLATPLAVAFLSACAITSPVRPEAASKSQFQGAAYSGETVSLEKATPGAESYRAFQQGATGFVSLQSVRSGVEEIASEFCGRKGKTFRGTSETAAKPPYILGNFPRVELIFECVAKSTIAGSVPEIGKYEKIAALKKLFDGGALTQQEFEAEKTKVLAAP